MVRYRMCHYCNHDVLGTRQYKKAAWIIYGGGVFILALLFILPDGMQLVEPRNGAKSWFHLPGIGSIQPAEFMKTFFIIGMARMITIIMKSL